jgi:hypothetical protein
MSIFGKAKELAGKVVGKAKELAGEVVGKVQRRLGGGSDDTDAVADPASSEVSDSDKPKTIPSDGAVTPADVAETVSDPDLPHPEANSGQQ